MITAKFNRYFEGTNETVEVHLKDHVTISGNEDHFHLAYQDAENVLKGLMPGDNMNRAGGSAAKDRARWTIRSIVFN